MHCWVCHIAHAVQTLCVFHSSPDSTHQLLLPRISFSYDDLNFIVSVMDMEELKELATHTKLLTGHAWKFFSYVDRTRLRLEEENARLST